MYCKVLIAAIIIYSLSIIIHLKEILYLKKPTGTLCEGSKCNQELKYHKTGIFVDLLILSFVYYFCKSGRRNLAILAFLSPFIYVFFVLALNKCNGLK